MTEHSPDLSYTSYLALGDILGGQRPRFDEQALAVSARSMTSAAPDGSPVIKDGRSSDVVRRQPADHGRSLIDSP